jgi:beta-amylase
LLQLGTINAENEVSEPEVLNRDLQILKRVGVDGVMVDCWWGLVESGGPQRYDWSGYHDLFNMVRDVGLKQQVLLFLLHFSSFLPIIRGGGLHCVC